MKIYEKPMAIIEAIEVEDVGTFLLCKSRKEGVNQFELYAAPATLVKEKKNQYNVFTDYDVNPNNPTLDTTT